MSRLDLTANRLVAVPPGSLGLVAGSLTGLHMAGNRLGVLDGDSFRHLSRLEQLDVADNGLAALPAGLFAGNPRLIGLDLANNSLSTVHLGVFRNLSLLQRLNLSRNHLDENWIKVGQRLSRARLAKDLLYIKVTPLAVNISFLGFVKKKVGACI